MSVPRSERKESTVEFIATAIRIESDLCSIVARLPKRFKDTKNKYLCDEACNIVNSTIKANSVFVKDHTTYTMRERFLYSAYVSCDVLFHRLDWLLFDTQNCNALNPEVEHRVVVDNTVCNVNKSRVYNLLDLIGKEKTMIKKVADSDRERFSQFS